MRLLHARGRKQHRDSVLACGQALRELVRRATIQAVTLTMHVCCVRALFREYLF